MVCKPCNKILDNKHSCNICVGIFVTVPVGSSLQTLHPVVLILNSLYEGPWTKTLTSEEHIFSTSLRQKHWKLHFSPWFPLNG